MATKSVCKIEDCGNPARTRGWCGMHYARWNRHGDPLTVGTAHGEPMKFIDEVVMTYEGDDCIFWPFAGNSISLGGKMRKVSRFVCGKVNGPPPTPKHEAAHECGKGHLACVTKRHLSWKTHAENLADKLIHDTHRRGERQWNAKLTEADVHQIIALKGVMLQREIAGLFGVTAGHVSDIHRKTRWSWLQEQDAA